MIFALDLLYSLGALDTNCKLTELGQKMADMPVDPRLAKALLSSFDLGCGEEMLSIAAMCSVDHPFVSLRARASAESKQRLADCVSEFACLDGDTLTLLSIYNGYAEFFNGGGGSSSFSSSSSSSSSSSAASSWCDSMMLQPRILARAREVRGHLENLLKKFSPPDAIIASCGHDSDTVRRCLISGYFANCAQLGSDGLYHTVKGKVSVMAHPSSVIALFGAPPEWVIFNEVVHSKTAQMREITKIDPKWLLTEAHHYYSVKKR